MRLAALGRHHVGVSEEVLPEGVEGRSFPKGMHRAAGPDRRVEGPDCRVGGHEWAGGANFEQSRGRAGRRTSTKARPLAAFCKDRIKGAAQQSGGGAQRRPYRWTNSQVPYGNSTLSSPSR